MVSKECNEIQPQRNKRSGEAKNKKLWHWNRVSTRPWMDE